MLCLELALARSFCMELALARSLDVHVHLSNNQIHTDLHTKPTDKHQYVLKSSCHHNHTKKIIPFSLLIKIRHICSTDTFDQCAHLLQHMVVRLNTIKVSQIPCQLPRQQEQGTRLPLSKDSLDATEGSSNLLGQEAETDCDRISFSPKGDKRFLPLTNAQLLQICFNCFFLIWLYD